MIKEQCQTCRFWKDAHDAWARKGKCRRYPPTLGDDGHYSDLNFPRTVSSNWCGEYQPASCDTHPEGGDEGNTSAPFMSGAVPPEEAGDAQRPSE